MPLRGVPPLTMKFAMGLPVFWFLIGGVFTLFIGIRKDAACLSRIKPQSALMIRQNPPLAIVFMISATAFIAATTLLAKALGTNTLGPPLHPFQVTQGRFMFALLGISTAVIMLRPGFSRPNMRLHIARTVCGFFGVTCMFAAAARIPLADATAISFLNPVFGMILAIPFLGERPGKWRWIAAATAFAGAVVLLRPGSGTVQPAALIALLAAFGLGFELIWIKKLAGRERVLQVLIINNAIGLTIATLAMLPVWQMPTGAQWAALAGLGLVMASAQAFFINAMARADASFVTPFSYMTLIFATLYDGAIFANWPDAVSYCGAALIIAGAALLAWREARQRA